MTGSLDLAFWRRQAPWLLSLLVHGSLLVAAADYWRRLAQEPPLAILPIEVRMVELPAPAPKPAAGGSRRRAEALLAGFKKWKFAPAFRFGRAVDSVVDYRLTLALE